MEAVEIGHTDRRTDIAELISVTFRCERFKTRRKEKRKDRKKEREKEKRARALSRLSSPGLQFDCVRLYFQRPDNVVPKGT